MAYNKPIAKVRLQDKINIIQCINSAQGGFIQFGLTSTISKRLGVADALKQHPKRFHPFYCNENREELTGGQLQYNVHYEFFHNPFYNPFRHNLKIISRYKIL